MAGDRSDWTSPEIRDDLPSAARVYDYFLGGGHNFAADRDFAHQVQEALPDMPLIARENRRFVIRVVDHLARAGFDQYIDVGCGLPVQGAVHEVARRVLPSSRVVYVDNDPIAVAHGRALLRQDAHALMIDADMRHPASYMDLPETLDLIDFGRPVVIVLAAVLHFVEDRENPAGIMAELRDRLSSGSRVVFSHGSARDAAVGAAISKLYGESATPPWVSRDRDQIRQLFMGYRVDEGPTWVTNIYPERIEPTSLDAGPRSQVYGAVLTVP